MKGKKIITSVIAVTLLFSSVAPTFAESRVATSPITVMVSDDFIAEQARLGNPIYEELDELKAQPQAKLKVIAYIIRAGGWALENLLKPFSKTAAGFVKKHRTKIADVLEEIETVSEMAITQALRSKNVPRKEAEAIAKLLVIHLL